MTKHEIVSEFINTAPEQAPALNYTAFNTNYAEVAGMYDKARTVVLAKRKWDDFLLEEKAVGITGFPRYDREMMVTFGDGVKTRTEKVRVVFKYFVYNWLRSQIKRQQDGLAKAQEMTWDELGRGKVMEGVVDLAKDTGNLKTLARGIAKTKQGSLLLNKVLNKINVLENPGPAVVIPAVEVVPREQVPAEAYTDAPAPGPAVVDEMPEGYELPY